MVKLYVIPARNEPTAVIFRRGPSRWYHVIQWDTRRDRFQHGAWIKGRIYEDRCDISPDGRLLIYFIHKGDHAQTEFTHAWTAISRVPWLQALVVWPQGMTYGGGGSFIDDRSVALRGVMGEALKDFPLRGLRTVNGDTPLQISATDVPGADWCGRDHSDHIVFSLGGQLFRRIKAKDIQIADFSELIPDPQEAPEWAGRPI